MTSPSSNAANVTWFVSLTAGHSDSEDRLWLRFTHPDREATVWITRRLLGSVLNQSFQLLSRNLAPELAASVHEEVVEPFLHKGGDPSPESPKAQTPRIAQGLISTVHLSLTPSGHFHWVFEVPAASVGLACTSAEAHCLLELLWQKQHSAGWGLPRPW
jgi:hypothetical protein